MAGGIELDAQRIHPVAGESGPPALARGLNELGGFLEFFTVLAAEYVVHRQAAYAQVPVLPGPHLPQGAPRGKGSAHERVDDGALAGEVEGVGGGGVGGGGGGGGGNARAHQPRSELLLEFKGLHRDGVKLLQGWVDGFGGWVG